MGSASRNFVAAFREHWMAAMSGSFSVPFTALAIFAGDKYQQIIFGTLALGALWFAAFRVWKAEHEKFLGARAELDRLKKVGPQFTGEIDAYLFGGQIVQLPGKVPLILIASISNVGNMQSVVKDFEILLLRDGKMKRVQLWAMPNYVDIDPDNGDGPRQPSIRYGSDQSLYQKAATPIESGAFIRGLLFTLLPDVDSKWIGPGTNILFSFKDIMGKKYQVSKEIKHDRSQMAEFPGLKGTINAES